MSILATPRADAGRGDDAFAFSVSVSDEVDGYVAVPAGATHARFECRLVTADAWAASPEAAEPHWNVRRIGPLVLARRAVFLFDGG